MLRMSFGFVDPYHKKNGPICKLLEEETLVEDILCEPHHLSGSLKEERENIMEDIKNFVETNWNA